MPKSEFPTEDEQREAIDEAAGETPAFSVSQEDIDQVLRRGSGFDDGKLRIFEHFQKDLSNQENAAFLKKEYGIGGETIYFPDGTRGDSRHDHRGLAIGRTSSSFTNPDLLLTWTKAAHRLR